MVGQVGAWPAASKTNASWPAHRLGREKWFVDGRRKRETEKVTLRLFPKGIHPRPQPAQPVGGPLRAFRWEGRRPGTKIEVQPPPPQPHQRRGSRGRNLLPRGFFPPFLPKKWGPGWASQGSRPFQRRRGRTPQHPPSTSPPPGMGIDFSDHNLYNVSQPNSCCGRGEPR